MLLKIPIISAVVLFAALSQTNAGDEPVPDTAFVIDKALGELRNNFSGWVGMSITVGLNTLTVTELGRMFVSGNSGTHTVKLVRASDQFDVPSGSVSIAMGGGAAGQFKYEKLGSAVTLASGTTYYLVSQEVSGGDQWHDVVNTSVTTTSAGNCNSGVYFSDSWKMAGTANSTYIPVDFKYVAVPSTNIMLAWDGGSGSSATEYVVHYGTFSGGYTFHKSVGMALNSTITGLTIGSRYFFAVTARNADGESLYSNEIDYTVPAAPEPILPGSPTNLQLTVEW